MLLLYADRRDAWAADEMRARRAGCTPTGQQTLRDGGSSVRSSIVRISLRYLNHTQEQKFVTEIGRRQL